MNISLPHNAGEESKEQHKTMLTPLPKLSSGEAAILALRKQLAALESSSVVCADGA
jgi:hypothetical protein